VLLPLASRLPNGLVAGVDHSDLMLRHAWMRTRRFVDAGRVRLVRGTSSDLSMFPDASFDHAFGIHVVALWRDPRADLGELHRVLRPGGRVLLAYRPAAERRFASREGASFAVARLEALLDEVGFRGTDTARTDEAGPLLAWTAGTR
jgi:ubiquinone/menaquinone biosynthesis C-methylase UbiE